MIRSSRSLAAGQPSAGHQERAVPVEPAPAEATRAARFASAEANLRTPIEVLPVEGEAVSMPPMRPDDPRIIETERLPQRHSWMACVPTVVDPKTGAYDCNDAENHAIRKIFATLRPDERVKFHQFTCQGNRSPVHLAVIEKIDRLFTDWENHQGEG